MVSVSLSLCCGCVCPNDTAVTPSLPREYKLVALAFWQSPIFIYIFFRVIASNFTLSNYAMTNLLLRLFPHFFNKIRVEKSQLKLYLNGQSQPPFHHCVFQSTYEFDIFRLSVYFFPLLLLL